jgi:hypothetical protein
MLRRICACLVLCAFLLQTGATAYACKRMGSPAAHSDHTAMAMESASSHASEGATRPESDRKRDASVTALASAASESIPEHCNRFHRADCPHRGAAFHPCPSEQVAGLQAVDAGLPLAPEAIVLGLDGLSASVTPTASSATARAPAPDLPPPRTV